MHKSYYEQDKFGDIAVLKTNKEGFIKRSFPNSGEFGIDYYLYDPINNIQYATYRFTDTVYYFEATWSGAKDVKLKGPTETNISLLGEQLDVIELTGWDPDQNVTLAAKYYFPKSRVPIDANTQAKNVDFKTNEAYSLSQSHFTISTMDYGNYECTMKASKVLPGAIADNEFRIPDDRPLKKSE